MAKTEEFNVNASFSLPPQRTRKNNFGFFFFQQCFLLTLTPIQIYFELKKRILNVLPLKSNTCLRKYMHLRWLCNVCMYQNLNYIYSVCQLKQREIDEWVKVGPHENQAWYHALIIPALRRQGVPGAHWPKCSLITKL